MVPSLLTQRAETSDDDFFLDWAVITEQCFQLTERREALASYCAFLEMASAVLPLKGFLGQTSGYEMD